jgi:hypothetical protein
MSKIKLPYHLERQIQQYKAEKKAKGKDRPAIIVEDGSFLDYDVDKTYKGNKGKDMHRGGV